MNGEARGLTMVELLAVLTIIGILSAITVPILWRVGAMAQDELRGGARELYAILRAARVYSSSNQARTGVVYGYRQVPAGAPAIVPGLGVPVTYDEALLRQRYYFDRTFMVRRLTRDEKNSLSPALQAQGFTLAQIEDNEWYVPIQDNHGQIRDMPNRTCFMLGDMAAGDWAALKSEVSSKYGVAWTYVCTLEGRPLWEWSPSAMQPPQPVWQFPAHVFKPSGMLKGTSSTRQRFVLDVTLLPEEENVSVRFVEDSMPTEENERVVPVELFATTGRVKVAG